MVTPSEIRQVIKICVWGVCLCVIIYLYLYRYFIVTTVTSKMKRNDNATFGGNTAYFFGALPSVTCRYLLILN